jgi:hypothetical protein
MSTMSQKLNGKSRENCRAEVELAREFPELYAFYSAHPVVRPERAEHWERALLVARNCQPILQDLRARGLDLVRVDQYTPPGTDRRPLYEAVIDWLPHIQDPLTLTICLCRLGEPGARALVKRNRELLLGLAREWNGRLREHDTEHTLGVLAQCVMKAVVESDLPEVLNWARGRSLPSEVRASYIFELERFARKPGLARDAIVSLVNDSEVGPAAVRVLGGALKAEALPLLCELRESSPHDSVRKTAAAVAQKIEARLRRVDLLDASPAMLPQGYASTSIELDTDCVPELLSILERELNGRLEPGIGQQLALSADQIKRGRRRFHIVAFMLPDRVATQLGFGLFAEDEDVTVVEIHFDARLQDAVNAALNRLMDGDSAKRD